jgi:RNA polymerase sigma-70 factor (ECF subfamily)
MDPHEPDRRLSEIETAWTVLHKAHQEGSAAEWARSALVLRYDGAVYHYLLGMVHDTSEAEELAQEFAVRFLRGDFGSADPQRRRFRDFLKTAVRHLAIDHWRQQKKEKDKGPRPLGEGSAATGEAATEPTDTDSAFLHAWRDDLLAKTWKALAQFEEETGHPYHTVLCAKIDRPELHSAQLAQHLGERLGKTFTELGVRQTLYRARQRFARLLVEEVKTSLASTDPYLLEQELIELGLLDYCRLALPRSGKPGLAADCSADRPSAPRRDLRSKASSSCRAGRRFWPQPAPSP